MDDFGSLLQSGGEHFVRQYLQHISLDALQTLHAHLSFVEQISVQTPFARSPEVAERMRARATPSFFLSEFIESLKGTAAALRRGESVTGGPPTPPPYNVIDMLAIAELYATTSPEGQGWTRLRGMVEDVLASRIQSSPSTARGCLWLVALPALASALGYELLGYLAQP